MSVEDDLIAGDMEAQVSECNCSDEGTKIKW